MNKSRERRFFRVAESAMDEDYVDDEGLNVSPSNLQVFLLQFSDDLLPNDKPGFSYAQLYDHLYNFDEVEPDHAKAVLEVGDWASKISRYGEVDKEMFAWGYNLYMSIVLRTDKLYILPTYGSKKIQSSFNSSTTDGLQRQVANLSDEARANIPFLWGAADDMLDGLILVHNERCDLEDDPAGSFEHSAIRSERLLVVRAGMGFAYGHCQQFLQRSMEDDMLGGAYLPEDS